MSTDVAPAAGPAVTANHDGAPPATEEEAGFKVFAGNLAYATKDEGLRAFFAPVADDVLSAHVIQRGSRSAGYGFVALSTLAAAEKAVAELNKQELDGRSVIVEIAKPSEEKNKDRGERRSPKKRVGRRGGKAPPGEVTEAEANGEELSDKIEATAESGAEAPAPVKPKKAKKSVSTAPPPLPSRALENAPSCIFTDASPLLLLSVAAQKPRRRTRKPAADSQSATANEAAVSAAEGTTENGVVPTEGEGEKKPRAKRVPRPPRAPRAEGEAPAGEPSKNMLFVANLAFDVDDAALSEIFTNEGITVVSARVVRRRWGQPRRSKGYGFVDVGTEEQQQKAIEATQGKEISGRAIAVKIAVNSAHRENGVVEEEAAHVEETVDKKEASPEPEAVVVAS
ncbi:hypothetical protein BOTBODRAFT_44553 [Botryobasidium botryosum FD-172 SS1]|uniref:RRM domain-containing protein n=1 Tax=Botryobasidium botryosum (strain FD-172 SS1) TaxID=930990 RepID=A0A067MGZ3_BOTB1|nr:hypothetical protein BOTBODRAFT_44553 [Botryobasidium botryosum FD-172 SS1]